MANESDCEEGAGSMIPGVCGGDAYPASRWRGLDNAVREQLERSLRDHVEGFGLDWHATGEMACDRLPDEVWALAEERGFPAILARSIAYVTFAKIPSGDLETSVSELNGQS